MALYHQNYLPGKQLCILLKLHSHSLQLWLVTQLVSQLASWIYCATRITFLAIRDQPITLLFLPIMLCCSAFKIHILCSRIRIFVRLLCFYMKFCMTIHYMQLTILYRLFYQSVLMKVPESSHTMTVLLEYIDPSLQFSINA